MSTYLDSAAEHDLNIELVIETHFHADFLSGHLELAAATGATIAYGSVADTEFESRKLADGERIELGDVVLEVRHTPGHTPESISIVVWEHPGEARRRSASSPGTRCSSATSAARPAVVEGRRREELAGQLFDSLHQHC